METFVFSFKVVPTSNNEYVFRTDSGYARVFVLEESVEKALAIAESYITARNWSIVCQDEQPGVLSFERSRRSDIASKCYDLAQSEGVSALFSLAEKLPSLSWFSDIMTEHRRQIFDVSLLNFNAAWPGYDCDGPGFLEWQDHHRGFSRDVFDSVYFAFNCHL